MNTHRDSDNLYDALGVEHDATDAEITQAYRRLARERHPDSNPAGERETFAEVTDAYDVLHDPERRRAYDDTRRARGRAAAAAAGVRIPVHHVGPEPRTARPDRRVPAGEVELRLTFDQAALGTTATVPVDAEHPCDTCAGTGTAQDSPATCEACGGAGATTRTSGGITIRTKCAECAGSGLVQPRTCTTCRGAGRHRRTRDVTVRVPAGVHDGMRLRVALPDGGELVAAVRVDAHAYFRLAGNDLTLRLPVTIAEAALGAVLTVPTLGGAVAIRLPPGTPSGRTMRVRGRGIRSGDRAGDLLVTVDVVIPTELNETQRAALEAFGAATESPRRHLESP